MKKLLCFAASVLMAVTVTSCGKKGEESDLFKPALDAATRCSIKVVGDYDNFEALEAEFDRFNEYYPHVVLSYRKTDNYVTKLTSALQNEDGPNIFFSYASWMSGDEIYAPIVQHMEDLSNPDLKLDLDCIRPGLINRDENGKTVMVPVFSRTYGMLVNEALFGKENIAIPNTWDELISACTSFSSKGYKSPMMGYSKGDSSCWMNTVAYPSFVATLAKNPEALALANNLDPSAGEYMREALTKVKQLVDSKAINVRDEGEEDPLDKDECDYISDNYKQVLLRFFEGDVPMMICTGDTVSGRKKREKESQEFKENPFSYTFVPIPMTNDGGYFIDSPSVEFSVNKDCKNLDMTNEFMRFLLRKDELKNLASLKGLITPVKDEPFGAVYASFQEIPAERTFSPEVLGVKDPLAKQIRLASHRVGRKTLTIDEAIAQYGTLS